MSRVWIQRPGAPGMCVTGLPRHPPGAGCTAVLADLRRSLQQEAESNKGKHVVEGIRWLLLKGGERLHHARNERQRVQVALELNAPLEDQNPQAPSLRIQRPRILQAAHSRTPETKYALVG